MARVVNDIWVAGKDDCASKYIIKVTKKFELDIIWSEPGQLRFFGLNQELVNEFTICTDANVKQNDMDEYQFLRNCCKEF